ncbi:MAG TPA: outer membrane beta-barrel protein [Gemmatimonadaceae bacterium]|nr:outer membrane beta-barrel protein [Gemmatimonadaceae bacterium]
MRRVFSQHASKVLVAAALAAAIAQPSAAQARAGTGSFHVGYTDIGPVLGLGGIGGANVAIGGRFEHAIQNLPSMANGVLGIQVGADYYSWSAAAGGPNFAYSWSIKYLPIGVTMNYHFKLDEPKLDPFVGLGLGYDIVSCHVSGTFTGVGDCGYDSGLYLIARGGVRYFFAPTMALYGDVGAGGATLNVGVMFKMH